jgi:hypothetical protein
MKTFDFLGEAQDFAASMELKGFDTMILWTERGYEVTWS